jgi:hypothetical protein
VVIQPLKKHGIVHVETENLSGLFALKKHQKTSLDRSREVLRPTAILPQA